ncbi:MAG: winged helix-turn-helix domain-containing protein, partial [Treponema sp.]|nr:winged helix-turn-helix domain-containing protein [Treponema sp.]
MNTEYLERFFRNIMLGENNELKNRYTHIDYDEYMKKFGENEKTSVQNTENFGVNEKTSVQIIEIMKNTPNITLQEIAEKLNRSKRAVEMQVKKLREQGIIQRIGADKNGHWEVIG